MQSIKNKLILTLIFMATVCLAVAFFCGKTAMAFSPTFTVIAGDKKYEFSGEELGFYKGNYYIKCLEGIVDGIYHDTVVKPVDATVTFTPNLQNDFSYTNEKSGKGIRRQKLIDDINTALYGGKWQVKAEFYEIKPKVSVIELKKATNYRAEFSTNYISSSSSRKHNVKLAVEKINGTVLEAGQVFSFNQIVGERTEERGFQNAVVIENGQFTEGVGGGVCQVSSTLYNCALLSGVKVVERRAHSILSNYVEPSFDAMVSGNNLDLKFINDTGANLYIKGVADGNNITFTFFGTTPTLRYERVSVIVNEIPPEEEEIILDSEMFIGETVLLRKAKNGLKSEGYLVVYNGLERVKTIKLHTDVYKSIRGQLKVGVKPKEFIDNELVIG